MFFIGDDPDDPTWTSLATQVLQEMYIGIGAYDLTMKAHQYANGAQSSSAASEGDPSSLATQTSL